MVKSMWVCVCVRERERERESDVAKYFHLGPV